MNAERLLQLYDRVSEAPDAIPRLRRFILNLAVRGKLVDQEHNDESGSTALEQLRAERGRREKSKTIKPLKLAYGPLSVGMGSKLPGNWARSTLGETCELQTGATPDRNRPEYFGGEIPWLVSGDINRGEIFECDGRITEAGLSKSNCKVLPPNSVLIALNGQGKTRGTVALLRIAAACNQSLVAITPLSSNALAPEYVHLSLKARYGAIRDLTGKDERRGLNMRLLNCFEIGIPPISEQHRIVAEVDELMALCDSLEAEHEKRETTRDRFTTASLSRLTAPEVDENQFKTHADFAIKVLPELTTRPDQIKVLRQTIMDLAVRGKLVEQDPNDGQALDVLSEIAARRAILKRQDDKELNPDGPYELPDSWSWTTLGTLVLDSDSGWSPRTENHARSGDAWGVLKVSAVSWDKFDPTANKQLLPGAEPKLRAQVHQGDFLISRANTAELIARAVIVDQQPVKLLMSDKIVRLRFVDLCDERFVLLVNNHASFARTYFASRATGVSPSMKNLSRTNILDLPIPFPPLPEQHRIVAQIDELMTLCDQLEWDLHTGRRNRSELLEALLVEAFGPATMVAA